MTPADEAQMTEETRTVTPLMSKDTKKVEDMFMVFNRGASREGGRTHGGLPEPGRDDGASRQQEGLPQGTTKR